MADSERIYSAARHPYTKALLSAAPIPDPARERARRRVRLEGEPPSPLDPRAPLRFLPSKADLDPVYSP
ncbi:MAG: oligopeptide/dipeptide ABC transporter ATP-binding protein, partial [Caulobacteraceae bacterium]